MHVKWTARMVAGALIVLTGCATPLNSQQKMELNLYKAKGLLVQEKSTGAAIALGFLPGCGSFYTRHYGLGVINLLTWPLSILWDPVSGYRGAESINYIATKTHVGGRMEKELKSLEDELIAGTISKEDFAIRKKQIERKYAADL